MTNIGTLLLLLHLLMPCTAFYASRLIKINVRAVQTVNPLKQAAEMLNVTQPGKVRFDDRSMLK